MEPILGILLIVALLAGASGTGLARTPAGRRVVDRWSDITAPGAQRTESGRRAATIARSAGWVGKGVFAAVRGGVDFVRSRRNRKSSTGGADTPDATGTVPPSRPAPPDVRGGTPIPPGGGPEPDAPTGGQPDAPSPADDEDVVDGEAWPSRPITAGPSSTTTAQTPEASKEIAVTTDIDLAGAGITHSQTRAALAVVEAEAAYLRQRAEAIGQGLELLAARLEEIDMDPAVVDATMEAMVAGRNVAQAAEILGALNEQVGGALAAGGHDDVAAAAAGRNLARTTGYYTEGV